ncbi:uncharacterized protein LOC130898093 [Diorhabda carinulata]|uniref:uncharacterized protein LOC130898093 n=1 Tax=Diorhabda carinulata TaxID=1163345 RepID=UPI0025A10E8E|nr:uncharacterized protein LOC130898093 [Diorhabda carinulata]
MCLPRTLVVAIANVDKDPLYTKVRRDIGKLQTTRALELMEAKGVSILSEGCGIPELQKFQQYLKNYKIIVYNYGSKGRDIIFEGTDKGSSLHLLYHEGHYNVITSLTAAFSCGYYCKECHVPYNINRDHRCGGTCPGCQQSPVCTPDEIKVNYESCKKSFLGQVCFENHIKHGICDQIRRCEKCFKIVPQTCLWINLL